MFTKRIIHKCTFLFYDHCAPFVHIKLRPMRNFWIIGVAGSRKGNPGIADFIGQNHRIRIASCKVGADLCIVERKWPFDVVWRLEHSSLHRTFPCKIVETNSPPPNSGATFGYLHRLGTIAIVAGNQEKEIGRTCTRITFSIQLNHFTRFIAKQLIYLYLQSGFVQMPKGSICGCLLYTSDAADEEDSAD